MAKRIGSFKDPTLPGQDPARCAAIEAQLFKDFAPKDVLEEIWLSEIATLTTTLEYYRELEAALNLKIAIKRGLISEIKKKKYKNDESATVFKNDIYDINLIRDTLGQFTDSDLKLINNIVEMISKIRRERERVYAQFERKRRPTLINIVSTAETRKLRPATIEKLSD